MAQLTPRRAFVEFIRTVGAAQLPTVDWATATDPAGSPFLTGVPDRAPAFPYVVYDWGKSSIEWHTEGCYVETGTLTIKVVGDRETSIETLSDPCVNGSIVRELDVASMNPQANFSGTNFQCINLMRTSYSLEEDDARGPAGQRVWVATAEYEYSMRVVIPNG